MGGGHPPNPPNSPPMAVPPPPQVGSYFGASLCALDTDGDGSAEVLLVGAPMFYGAGSGGRVAACALRPKVGDPQPSRGRGGCVGGSQRLPCPPRVPPPRAGGCSASRCCRASPATPWGALGPA